MSRHTYADIDPQVVNDFIDYLTDDCGFSWYELAVKLHSSVKRLFAVRFDGKPVTEHLWRRIDALYLENVEGDPPGYW